ncbi:unnamed protein product [Knipowitschia caucasica]
MSLGAISFTFLVAIIVLVAVRKYKGRPANGTYTLPFFSECCCSSRSNTSTGKEVFKKSNLTIRMPPSSNGLTEANANAIRQAYCYKMCLTPEASKSDFMFLKPCSPVMSVQQNNVKSTDYLTSGWSTLDRNEVTNNTSPSPNELKSSNKDWTWTKNERNLAYKRYSTANMDGTLSRQPNYDGESFSCSVAPQYWTWGSHMKDCKLSLQEASVSNYSWTPKYAQTNSEEPDYQHNVYIPGTTSGYSTLKLPPRGELDVHNSFSTFGKKKRLISNYEQTFDKDNGLISNDIFK